MACKRRTYKRKPYKRRKKKVRKKRKKKLTIFDAGKGTHSAFKC